MLLRHGVLAAAVVITIIYLLGVSVSVFGPEVDGDLLDLARTVTAVAWFAWIGVAVRDSVIEHQRAMSRIRRPER